MDPFYLFREQIAVLESLLPSRAANFGLFG
jgi:hypothetical protein